MLLLAQSGQRGAALAQYETCREVLSDELGASPSTETEDLYQVLLSGELPPPLTEVPPPERPPRRVGACPYRGLSVFREQDAPFFFGREEAAFTACPPNSLRSAASIRIAKEFSCREKNRM